MPLKRRVHCTIGALHRTIFGYCQSGRVHCSHARRRWRRERSWRGSKTPAVINVGYATLGGLIGARGYGQPILEGLRRYDPQAILLQGVVPAAAMALALQRLFELAERRLVPQGLRLRAGG